MTVFEVVCGWCEMKAREREREFRGPRNALAKSTIQTGSHNKLAI